MGQDFIGYILGRVAHSLPGYTERALRGLKQRKNVISSLLRAIPSARELWEAQGWKQLAGRSCENIVQSESIGKLEFLVTEGLLWLGYKREAGVGNVSDLDPGVDDLGS